MKKKQQLQLKYNYDVIAEIPKILNTEFKQKNRLTANSSYSGFSFINSVINNDFDFITYNKNRTAKTQHKEFIINTSKLADYVNYYVEEYVELEKILEALGLTDIIKAKPDYKEPYIAENVEPEVIKNIHDSFKKYFSVAAEVLEIAMKYNRQHKEEHEKIRTKLRANKEATDYLKQLEANLF